jgi:hypothetical protein
MDRLHRQHTHEPKFLLDPRRFFYAEFVAEEFISAPCET